MPDRILRCANLGRGRRMAGKSAAGREMRRVGVLTDRIRPGPEHRKSTQAL